MAPERSQLTELTPSDGRPVTDLDPGIYTVAGYADIVIVVREAGVAVDVVGRTCPHRDRDLALNGKVSPPAADGNSNFTCWHTAPAWDLPSGMSRCPGVADLLVYPAILDGGVLLADLSSHLVGAR